MNKILVTGTGGFLGGLIALHLKNHFYIETIEHRSDWSEKLSILKDISIIIHSGFTVDFSPQKVPSEKSLNYKNTQLLIEFAERVSAKQFIFLNAAGVLGVSNSPSRRNESHWNNSDFPGWLNSQYLQDKIACEKLLKSRLGAKLANLYLSTCYGKGMDKKVQNHLGSLGKSFNPFVLCPPGGTSFLGTRDFLSALDIVVKQNILGDFVLSSGDITFSDLFRLALAQNRSRADILTLPRIEKTPLLKWMYSLNIDPITLSSFGYKYYSAQKFTEATSWSPRETMRDLIANL